MDRGSWIVEREKAWIVDWLAATRTRRESLILPATGGVAERGLHPG